MLYFGLYFISYSTYVIKLFKIWIRVVLQGRDVSACCLLMLSKQINSPKIFFSNSHNIKLINISSIADNTNSLYYLAK